MNKTVIVIGASGDIGASVSKVFANNNYNVVLCYYLNEQTVLKLAKDLNKITRTLTVKLDIRNENDIKQMFANASLVFGKLNCLINCSGITLNKLLIDQSTSEIENQLNTNLLGTINCTKFCLPYMLKFNEGNVINISSVFGITGASCESVYAATKAGINGFTKSIAKEMGKNGIRINAIAPGIIETKMNKNLSKKERQEFAENTALNKIGSTQNVAETALFLASEKAEYITGQIISVDGGII